MSTEPITVAFQGVHGAYSEEAIRQHFGEAVKTVPCDSFRELFEAVESKRVTYGMQPIENSLAGTVATASELLLEFDLRIQAEVILRVRHALLAVPGTTIAEVKRVMSHPQALAQCDGYLRRRNMEQVAWFDTAGSARDLAAHPEPNTAAIAGALAGKLYGMEALDYGIEDDPQNYTRMFVIGHGDPQPGANNKTSLVFVSQNQPGALHGCLGEFATRGINLTKIESKPRRNKPWQYYMYVDFDGHFKEPQCEAALMGLLRRAAMLKVLGSYPAAIQPDDNRSDKE